MAEVETTEEVSVTRDVLLKRSQRRIKKLPLQPFGVFRIRSLFESEMLQIRKKMLDKRGEIIQSRAQRMNQFLVAWCLIDDQDNRLLSDDDVMNGLMDEMDGALVAALAKECREWTGFASDGDWQAIEDAAKN